MSSAQVASAAQVAQVAPVTATPLASERLLAVDPHLAPLFRQPGGDQAGPAGQAGLVRGQTIHCTGTASWALALALVAEATRKGAWLAAVDAPALGVEAAAELGIPLERLVSVETGSAAHWPEVMGAVVDGFELVVTSAPARVSTASGRNVHQRIRSRGAVLVVVSPPASGAASSATTSLPVDLRVGVVGGATWEGLGDGHGHLSARRLVVEVSGRRVPRPRSMELWLPGPSGRIEAIAATDGVAIADGTVDDVAGEATVAPLRDAS